MKRMNYIAAAGVLLAMVLAVFAADELSQTDGWTYDKNGRKRSKATGTQRSDITGDGVIENVQSVSTNPGGDALVLGSVTNCGFAYFKNLGPDAIDTNSVPTNLVQVGSYDVNTNFVAFLSLNTNQTSQGWLAISAPRARATGTNSVKLDYAITDR